MPQVASLIWCLSLNQSHDIIWQEITFFTTKSIQNISDNVWNIWAVADWIRWHVEYLFVNLARNVSVWLAVLTKLNTRQLYFLAPIIQVGWPVDIFPVTRLEMRWQSVIHNGMIDILHPCQPEIYFWPHGMYLLWICRIFVCMIF
jgi:hypothetical protein